MPTTRRRILGCLAAGALMTALTGSLSPASPARADDSPWRRVALPATAPRSALDAVDARTGADVWAGGYEGGESNAAMGRPLLLHWTGSAWHRTPVAGPAWTGKVLSVAASGPRMAWATAQDSDGAYRLLRWDGMRWTGAAFPGQDAGAGAYKVFAGPGGETWLRTADPAGLLRRAGGTWQTVPDPPSAPSIANVRVMGPGDVWVTGALGSARCYAARWDGSSWHELPTYDRSFYAGFVDVAPVAGDDVWAVGNARGIGTAAPITPVLAHWDGNEWTPTDLQWIPSPTVNVGAVRSLAVDDRRRPAWIGITDTYGIPPDAATYARFTAAPRQSNSVGRWTEVYGPADDWNSYPRMFVTHAPGTSTYWAVGASVDADGNTVARIERTG